MRVTLNVTTHEMNQEFIELIKTLLDLNAEIVIRKEALVLEEYDTSVALEQVMQEFSSINYSSEFLADLEQGLKTSSVYAK